MSEWDFDLSALHGPQETTAEDRAYQGSRYSEVRDAAYANPYRAGRSGETPGPLPMFKSTIRNAWKGVFPFTGPDLLNHASARSVDSHADLRWGPDGKGFRRMLSPNGILVFGKWEITEPSEYSGFFKRGAAGLFIGRYSSDGNETMRGQRRSLSLAGKIYPTLDPGHATPLRTASFMSQEDLGGMKTDYINDAELRNAPNITAYRRGIYFLVMVRAGMVFTKLDKAPESRMLYEIAELGKPADEPTRAPWHMMLKMTPGQPHIPGDRLDFRDEIYAHIFKPGESEPTGSIEFDISVSDTARTSGIPGFRRVAVSNWKRIGRVTLTEAVASFNGDHVVQFHHPGWRDNPNDPSTAIRENERRVRK